MSGSPGTTVAFGRNLGVARALAGRVSVLIDVRATVVAALLLGLLAVVTVVAVSGGEFSVSPVDALWALTGNGDPFLQTVVREWRLPRALLAGLLGASLGVAGAIFQSLTRNPLGSPDVIGFDTGAYAGALVVIIHLGGGYGPTAAGALAGGALTAAAVYLLAWKRGVQGFRMIVVGVSVGALLATVCAYMVLRAELPIAMAASFWGAGSLNDADWAAVRDALVALVPLAVLVVLVARPMALLELGDDVAAGRGQPVERTRVALVLLGVTMSAVPVALVGPIAFVSLAAPQLARRAARTPAIGLGSSAAMGALLLGASDLIARRGWPGVELPVGTVTVVIGGTYLVWLLATEGRRA